MFDGIAVAEYAGDYKDWIEYKIDNDVKNAGNIWRLPGDKED